MKILHICNGATQRPLYKNLFLHLQKEQEEQCVVAATFEHPLCDFETIPCRYFYRNKNWMSRLLFLRKTKKIFRLTETEFDVSTFDIIHAHTWFSDGAVAYRLHKKYGTPYIIAIRNTDVNVHFKYFLHLRKWAYQILIHASKIVFISPAYKDVFFNKLLKKTLSSRLINKAVIIPNGIDHTWLENRKVERKQVNVAFNIVFAGSFDKNKNIISVIKAVSRLQKKRNIPLQFTIVGKGYSGNKSYTKQLDVLEKKYDFVKILPKLSKEDLMTVYRDQHLFVMPSHRETFGLVYIEALSQGLPVVYATGQGIDGIFIPGEVGVSVDSKDIYSIKEGIESCITHYAELTSRISKVSLDSFMWENIANEYISLYHQVRCL